ncbi:hypothetical protein H6G33_09985 [Calothrix sp. FACHB-1219]|uniref:hypothetical protein n=1 Tax=unclassified Calothrix TaxID=2619626 RepID=UPI00168735F3|nr:MULTISPECIES: hypothetical protein [unclassified Calothrix]MBD2201676.1 hypothetical protein [Calothrix sp. FACHB-168]MBD2217362.1 hypothetical protein [Calothrix sp. FACHB-1219]
MLSIRDWELIHCNNGFANIRCDDYPIKWWEDRDGNVYRYAVDIRLINWWIETSKESALKAILEENGENEFSRNLYLFTSKAIETNYYLLAKEVCGRDNPNLSFINLIRDNQEWYSLEDWEKFQKVIGSFPLRVMTSAILLCEKIFYSWNKDKVYHAFEYKEKGGLSFYWRYSQWFWDNHLRISMAAPKKLTFDNFQLGTELSIGGMEESIGIGIYLWIVNIYLTLELNKFFKNEELYLTGFQFFSELFWIKLWHPDSQYGKRMWTIRWLDILLGNLVFQRSKVFDTAIAINLPESNYNARLLVEKNTRYRRWGLFKEEYLTYDVEIKEPGGIPMPGDSDSDYYDGDDAIYRRGGRLESTISEALEEIVSDIMTKRNKAGWYNDVL